MDIGHRPMDRQILAIKDSRRNVFPLFTTTQSSSPMHCHQVKEEESQPVLFHSSHFWQLYPSPLLLLSLFSFPLWPKILTLRFIQCLLSFSPKISPTQPNPLPVSVLSYSVSSQLSSCLFRPSSCCGSAFLPAECSYRWRLDSVM